MATIYEISEQQRRALLRAESATAKRLTRIYAQTLKELDALTLTLKEQMRMHGAGKRSSAAVRGAAKELADEVLRLLFEATGPMAGTVTTAQVDAMRRGVVDANRLMTAGVANAPVSLRLAASPRFRVPAEALQYLAGNLADGSPLRDLFRQLAGETADLVEQRLGSSIAQGMNPVDTAKRIRDSLGVGLDRSLLIARTEQLRVYRQAAHENYRVNADVVTGWTWHATDDELTCPVCLAMHGTQHPNDQTLISHPNCRCAPIPNVPGGRDLQTGEDRFRNMSEREQRDILGSEKLHSLYRSGKINLIDVAQPSNHPRWGRGLRKATPAQALARAAARRDPTELV